MVNFNLTQNVGANTVNFIIEKFLVRSAFFLVSLQPQKPLINNDRKLRAGIAGIFMNFFNSKRPGQRIDYFLGPSSVSHLAIKELTLKHFLTNQSSTTSLYVD